MRKIRYIGFDVSTLRRDARGFIELAKRFGGELYRISNSYSKVVHYDSQIDPDCLADAFLNHHPQGTVSIIGKDYEGPFSIRGSYVKEQSIRPMVEVGTAPQVIKPAQISGHRYRKRENALYREVFDGKLLPHEVLQLGRVRFESFIRYVEIAGVRGEENG